MSWFFSVGADLTVAGLSVSMSINRLQNIKVLSGIYLEGSAENDQFGML